jgi:hypothetical protein
MEQKKVTKLSLDEIARLKVESRVKSDPHNWEPLKDNPQLMRCKHCGVLAKSVYCDDCGIRTPHIPLGIDRKAKSHGVREQVGLPSGELILYECTLCGTRRTVREGGVWKGGWIK